MKIKPGFLLRKIGEDTYAVAATRELADLGAMIRLNPTGELLWRLLEQEHTREELADALVAEYGIERTLAEADADAFCRGLGEAGLLV